MAFGRECQRLHAAIKCRDKAPMVSSKGEQVRICYLAVALEQLEFWLKCSHDGQVISPELMKRVQSDFTKKLCGPFRRQ